MSQPAERSDSNLFGRWQKQKRNAVESDLTTIAIWNRRRRAGFEGLDGDTSGAANGFSLGSSTENVSGASGASAF